MDNRTVLPQGHKLSFPAMECTVEGIIGKGSNSIAYLCSYPDEVNRQLYHRVIVKELFPLHPDGKIYRNSVGELVFSEATEYFELHRRSFVRGNEIHLSILEKSPDRIGANINTFRLNSTLYGVLGFDGGRTLENTAEIKSVREAAVFMLQFLDALGAFHDNGYLHLDISPDNILITGKGDNRRVSLIDFNSVYSKNEISDGCVAYFSLKEGYTAPETVSGVISDINEATDLYSATAVFYRLVTGKTLTNIDRTAKRPPVVRRADVGDNVPDTVIYHISSVLRKGLSTLSSKRYKSCEEMKEDMLELIRRTDGTGITHASLWEAGRSSVHAMIKANAALHYLKNESELYPLEFISSSGMKLSSDTLADKSTDEKKLLLYGEGGMGKTTVFLQTVLEKTAEYSPVKPAVLYVSLYGYNGSDGNYIINSILSLLKFDESIREINEARHRLVEVLNTPVKLPSGEKPSYLLLIDGLNEASGDTSLLLKEILMLSHLKGVMTVVSSRERTTELPFESIRVAPLSDGLIRETLTRKRLLYPESREIAELIRNPMMLTVYCKAAEAGGRQLFCNDEKELIEVYIKALCEKEKRALEENSPGRYVIAAATEFVLPAICSEIEKKHRALTDEEMFALIKKCFGVLSGRRLPSLFPQWAGHSRDIKAGCKNAEEWFGVIENILRFRLALIIKEQGKGTRIVHQNISEYLAFTYLRTEKKIKRRKTASAAAIALSALSLFVVSTVVLLTTGKADTYDEKLSLSYLECVSVTQANNGRSIALMEEMIERYCAGDDIYSFRASELINAISVYASVNEKGASGSLSEAEDIYKRLVRTGKVMPGSEVSISENDLRYLYDFNSSLINEYGNYVKVFLYVVSDEALYEKYGAELISRLREKIRLDAMLSDMLCYYMCTRHTDYLKEADSERYGYFADALGGYSDLSDEEPVSPDIMDIEAALRECAEAEYELLSLEIFTVYERNSEK